MEFTELLWFFCLVSPFIGVGTVFYIRYYQKKLNTLISTIISLFLAVEGSMMSILIIILSNYIGGKHQNVTLTDSLKITLDWYWFLLIISPIIGISIFLGVTTKRESMVQFYSTIMAIVLALLVSSVLIIFAKGYDNSELVDRWLRDPFYIDDNNMPHIRILDPVIEAYQILINASFGFDKFHLLLDGNPSNDSTFYRELGRTLGLATPLIFTALVFALSAKAGLFNIGAEGAFTVGGFIGAVIGVWLPDILPVSLPEGIVGSIIHLFLAFLCAALIGALFGAIPGILKAYLGAHEVITTIMLNPVAFLIVFMMCRDYYTVPDLRTETPTVKDSCKFDHLLPGPLGAEYFIAIFLAGALYFFLFRTNYGLEMRAIGENPTAAEYAGIPVRSRQVQAMSISGAIGAIGGAGLAIGYFHYFHPSHPMGIGFDGIAVSVLGSNSPLAIILVAVLFGTIKNGGENLSTSMGIPKDIIAAIRGLVILFAAAPMLFALVFRKRRVIQDENNKKDDSFLENKEKRESGESVKS